MPSSLARRCAHSRDTPVAHALTYVEPHAVVPQEGAFWRAWNDRVRRVEPELVPVARADRDPDAPAITHTIEGDDGVRLGVTLLRPPERVGLRGAVVYVPELNSNLLDVRRRRLRPILNAGTAIALLSLRGTPGSRRDTGDLATRPEGWETAGLAPIGDPRTGECSWVVSQTSGDIVRLTLALRAYLGSQGLSVPIGLSARCVAGGPGVVAASQLTGDDAFARVMLAFPSLGGWSYRFAHEHAGRGESIIRFIESRPDTADELRAVVRRFDAALLAPRVTSPALVMVAIADENVPPAAQASIHNAIGSAPGQRWRFVVPHAHTDGTPVTNRRKLLFERVAGGFLNFAAPAHATMRRWEPFLTEGHPRDRADASVETPGDAPARAAAQAPLFPGDHPRAGDDRSAALIEAYLHAKRTLDDLPYTREFEMLYSTVFAGAPGVDRAAVLRRLQNLRKAGKLPRQGRIAVSPPSISAPDAALLTKLVTDRVGTLGHRDALPYTEDFDSLVNEFNAATGQELHPHSVWRIVSRLAKHADPKR